MKDHVKRAEELFLSGANCSQAVFAAFSDVTGIEEQTAIKMAAGFGGGFGRMREVCGAVSGMCLTASCLYGYTDLSDPQAKKEHYALISRLMNQFKEITGSYLCHELLGLDKNAPYAPSAQPRTNDFYKTRPCLKCVKTAASLLETVINA